jgi:hypothetical protein
MNMDKYEVNMIHSAFKNSVYSDFYRMVYVNFPTRRYSIEYMRDLGFRWIPVVGDYSYYYVIKELGKVPRSHPYNDFLRSIN